MKENRKIIITIGLPAGGKSTWSKNFIAKHNNFVKVGRDEFRYMLKNQGFCEPNIEKLITDLVNMTIENCLAARQNVIYDATNLKVKSA